MIAINNPYGIISLWVSREIGYTTGIAVAQQRQARTHTSYARDVLLTQTVCSFYFTNC